MWLEMKCEKFQPCSIPNSNIVFSFRRELLLRRLFKLSAVVALQPFVVIPPGPFFLFLQFLFYHEYSLKLALAALALVALVFAGTAWQPASAVEFETDSGWKANIRGVYHNFCTGPSKRNSWECIHHERCHRKLAKGKRT